MTIDLQYSSSEPERLTKTTILISRLEGTLRNSSTIIDPQILIESSVGSIARVNYMTIYEFNRSYFVTNIESVSSTLSIVHAHVDVLSSFASAIRSNRAVIERQANVANLYLDDGSFHVYQNPIIETRSFPSGFSDYMYLLVVAG